MIEVIIFVPLMKLHLTNAEVGMWNAEILFLFSCYFVGFVAINTPYKKFSFFIDQTGRFFLARGAARVKLHYSSAAGVT